MNKETENKSIKKDPSRSLVAICLAAVALVAVLVLTLLPVLRKNRVQQPAVPVFESDEEAYEYYVGPEEHPDRGEWVDPCKYFELFQDSNKEADLVNTFFGDGELKGLVPAGVRIEPVMLSYDDFEPYEGPMNHGFLDIYKVERYSDANGDLTEPVELQLGIKKNGLRLYNSYSIELDDAYYTANARLTLLNINYYLNDGFDPDADGEVIGVPKSTYGFLEPSLTFDYSGIVSAGKYDKDMNRTGTIEVELDGTMDDGMWMYTVDLCGQLNTRFKTGELYIRCRLPAEVTETDLVTGEVKNRDSYVNVYFKVHETRLGTRADCMPEPYEEEAEPDEAAEAAEAAE